MQALHAGVPALVTDGWPMNELIEHAHNGLLVPASHTGDISEGAVSHPPSISPSLRVSLLSSCTAAAAASYAERLPASKSARHKLACARAQSRCGAAVWALSGGRRAVQRSLCPCAL